MDNALKKNISDAELIRDAYYTNFAQYANEPLIIYGIGVMTKVVLDSFPWFHVVGLMDETRAGESIYGKPILSESDVIRLGVKRIVIIATANNTNIIFHRIARFCRDNSIDVHSIDGKLLAISKDAKKNFEKFEGVSFENLKSKIDASDVISFDVFDTLIMRQVLYPRDIFHIVGRRNGISGYYDARIKAETELHPGESIYQIYDGVAKLLGLDADHRDALLRAEIATEKEFIVARGRVVSALEYALSMGKQVYLVSDMYIPNELLTDILLGVDIAVSKENILVSCDFGVGKGNGLFDILRRHAGDKKILHIGDNKVVDIDSAQKYGIDDTFLLHSAYEMLLDSTMADILIYTQKLSDRLFIGRFICTQLNDPFLFQRTGGKLEVTDNYSLGQSFFAPIIFNYIIWLAEQVSKESFDCIFCSARDGWLIKKIIEDNSKLREMFPKLLYYYTSRKTAMRILLESEEDIREVLKIKHADTTADILQRNFCLTSEEILPYNGESEETYIIRHKNAIYAHAEQTKQNSIKYLDSLHMQPKAKVGYIDFTSSGTTQLGLTRISDLDVKGLYFLRLGGREFLEEKENLNIASLFAKQSFYYTGSKLLNYYTELENVLTSYEPTVDEFDSDGKPLFAEERRSDAFFRALEEIHQAIMEYCGRFDLDLFTDCTNTVSELLFSYLHEDFSVQCASYFADNYVYDDVPNRVWKIFGNGNDSKRGEAIAQPGALSKMVDRTRPVVFYGAGGLAPSYTHILLHRGLEAVCFADRDASKHGSLCMGKPVLALEEALRKYPNAYIFITTSSEKWETITKFLIETGLVAYGQILNYQIGKKYRSCRWIEHSLTVTSKSLRFCCVAGRKPPQINVSHAEEANIVEKFLDFRQRTIARLNSEADSGICVDCAYLADAYYLEEGEGKLTDIHLVNEGVCQFDCIYCKRSCINGKMTSEDIPDYGKLLDELERANLIDKDHFYIDVSCDEITVLPNGGQIIGSLSKYPLIVYTNAGVFSQELADALQNGESKIITSIDAGTRETFAKIKQRDVFDSVCGNLKRYAEYGKVGLKYILLPDINDNEQDLNGFIELCKEVQPDEVLISRETFEFLESRADMPERTILRGKRFIQSLRENGFKVSLFGDFTDRDVEILEN